MTHKDTTKTGSSFTPSTTVPMMGNDSVRTVQSYCTKFGLLIVRGMTSNTLGINPPRVMSLIRTMLRLINTMFDVG